MALNKATKTITLSKGMRDDVDYKQLEPPHCKLIKNGRFQKEGVISKRRGLAKETTTYTPGGDPLAVINVASGPVLVGTEGVSKPSGPVSGSSKLLTSRVEHSGDTGTDIGHYYFDKSGDVLIESWYETFYDYTTDVRNSVRHTKIFNGTDTFRFAEEVSNIPLATTCRLLDYGNGEQAIFAFIEQDDTDQKIFIKVYDYSDGSSDGYQQYTDATDLVERNNYADGGCWPRILYDGTLAYVVVMYQDLSSGIAFTVKYLVGLNSVVSQRSESGSNAIGGWSDGSNYGVIYNDNRVIKIDKRRSLDDSITNSFAAPVHNTTTLTIPFPDNFFRKASYAISGATQAIAYSYRAAENQTNTRVYVDDGTKTFITDIRGEMPFCEVFIKDSEVYIGCTPYVERPEVVRDLFPIGTDIEFKPRTGTIYRITESNAEPVTTVGTNLEKSFDYLTQTDSFKVLNVLEDGFDRLVPVRTIRDGVGYKRPAVYQVKIHRISDIESVNFGRTPVGNLMSGGLMKIVSDTGLTEGTFTNTPEIVSVKLDDAAYLPGTVPGEGGKLYGSVPDLPDQGTADPIPALSFDSTQHILYIGVQVVAVSENSGRILRSAPSSTVYFSPQAKYTVNTGGAGNTFVQYQARSFELGLYLPPEYPENTRIEVYAFIASADGYDDATPAVVVQEDPLFIGAYSPKTNDPFDTMYGNFSIDVGPNSIEYGRSSDTFVQAPIIPSGRTIYTVGEVSSDVVPPPELLERVGNRVFLIADNRLYYSKILSGDGIIPEFPVLYSMALLKEDPKRIASLDDKLVIFYEDKITVVFGTGPDNAGNGQEFQQQELPGDIGLKDIHSVVSVPQGVMFRSDRGFYLLDRGIVLTYLGGVEDTIRGTTVTSAVNVESQSEVIFSLNVDETGIGGLIQTTQGPPPGYLGNVNSDPVYSISNTYQAPSLPGLPELPTLPTVTLVDENPYAVVYNYNLNEWSVYTNHDFVGMVDINGYLYGVKADWTLWRQKDSTYEFPYEDDGAPRSARQNLLRIESPWIKATNMQDFHGLRKITTLVNYINGGQEGSDIRIYLKQDYEVGTPTIDKLITRDDLHDQGVLGLPERTQVSLRPNKRKCQSVQIIIQEQKTNNTGGDVWHVGRGFEIDAIDLEYQAKGGPARLPKERKF